MQLWSSHVGAKYQVTIPKGVRDALGIRRKGEIVGFLVDGSKITLTKAEIAPQADPFTEEEWAKLLRLAHGPATKPRSGSDFLARHKRRACR